VDSLGAIPHRYEDIHRVLRKNFGGPRTDASATRGSAGIGCLRLALIPVEQRAKVQEIEDEEMLVVLRWAIDIGAVATINGGKFSV